MSDNIRKNEAIVFLYLDIHPPFPKIGLQLLVNM
jgi:hypothetical protein